MHCSALCCNWVLNTVVDCTVYSTFKFMKIPMTMSRSISSYDFSKAVKHKLIKAGFNSESCFKDITPLSLSKGQSFFSI